MLEDAIHVDQSAHVIFGEHFNLVHFVRGAKAVKEMDKRDARFEGGSVGDERHVHRLLHGVRACLLYTSRCV